MPPPEAASSSLLSDPLLAPFLSSDFSPTAYLNRTLPPLSVTAGTSIPRHTSPAAKSVPLADLHSTATKLLSSLDVNLSKLQKTLSGLTDDILRVTPRLSYEVEVLRSEVLSVAESLVSEDVTRLIGKTADGEGGVTIGGMLTHKPEPLQKLEVLVTVHKHLEDVIRIFGEAMEWTLSEQQIATAAAAAAAVASAATSGSGSGSVPNLTTSYAPPPTTSTSTGVTNNPPAKISGSDKLEQEISYLVASNELEKATKKVEDLSKLCAVWEHTGEHMVRTKFVDSLRWKVIEAGKQDVMAEEPVKSKEQQQLQQQQSERSSSPSGRDGYYSLINQLSRMRGS